MNHYYLVAGLIFSLAFGNVVSAQGANVNLDANAGVKTRPVQVDAKAGADVNAQVSTTTRERWAEMDARRETMRAQYEAKRASSTAKRVAIQKDVAERKVQNTTRTMLIVIERLENIATRIESRIAKIEAAGEDAAQSEAYVAAAKSDLASAEAKINAFASIDLSSESIQENFDKIRKAAAEAREIIRSAHTNLMLAVRSLPHVEVEAEVEATTTDSQT